MDFPDLRKTIKRKTKEKYLNVLLEKIFSNSFLSSKQNNLKAF